MVNNCDEKITRQNEKKLNKFDKIIQRISFNKDIMLIKWSNTYSNINSDLKINIFTNNSLREFDQK